jgi:hypothetical protein
LAICDAVNIGPRSCRRKKPSAVGFKVRVNARSSPLSQVDRASSINPTTWQSFANSRRAPPPCGCTPSARAGASWHRVWLADGLLAHLASSRMRAWKRRRNLTLDPPGNKAGMTCGTASMDTSLTGLQG